MFTAIAASCIRVIKCLHNECCLNYADHCTRLNCLRYWYANRHPAWPWGASGSHDHWKEGHYKWKIPSVTIYICNTASYGMHMSFHNVMQQVKTFPDYKLGQVTRRQPAIHFLLRSPLGFNWLISFRPLPSREGNRPRFQLNR